MGLAFIVFFRALGTGAAAAFIAFFRALGAGAAAAFIAVGAGDSKCGMST